MVRFTWLKSSYDTRGSHSTITGSEASPRLTSIQNTDSQPDIYQGHTISQEGWMQTWVREPMVCVIFRAAQGLLGGKASRETVERNFWPDA